MMTTLAVGGGPIESLVWMLTPGFVATLFAGVLPCAAVLAVLLSCSQTAAEKHNVLFVGVFAAAALLLHSSNLRFFLGWGPAGGEARWFHSLYVIGCLVAFAAFTVIQIAGFVIIRRTVRYAQEPRPELARIARDAASRMRLARVPRIVLSDRSATPFVTLVRGGTVVLPLSFEFEPVEVQTGVLMHEMAHIRREDCVKNFVCQLCGVLLWWNPFYWLAMHRLKLERELACDHAVLQGHNDIAWYADILARFALRPAADPILLFASSPMATKSTLRIRLESIVPGSYRWNHLDFLLSPISNRGMVITVVLLCLFALLSEILLPGIVADVVNSRAAG
jgi:beta-lactamase regulating signal transducer with metallopeptidase domain